MKRVVVKGEDQDLPGFRLGRKAHLKAAAAKLFSRQ